VLTLSLSQKDGPAPTKDHARLTAALFGKVNMVIDNSYTLYANRDNNTAFGASLRHLPASLAEPLSLELPIAAKIELPVTVAAASPSPPRTARRCRSPSISRRPRPRRR
jgi:hypothetical protein